MEGATPVLPAGPALPGLSSPWAGAGERLWLAVVGGVRVLLPRLVLGGAVLAVAGAVVFVAGLRAGRKGVARAGLALGLLGGGLWAAGRAAAVLLWLGR